MTGTSNSNKAALGDRVFLDLDGDGFQDGNEPGVAHVTVRLQTPKGETIRNVVTDDNGFFLFDNLDPGDYKFTVVEPDGFDGFTIQNARGVDDSADSDVNPNTGMSPIIHLSPGEDNRTVDAGLKPKPEPEPEPEPEPATLGNFVFNDLDGDGFQDPNEPGVEGVLVRLQTPDGTEVSTTTTNNNGKYLFDNLDPGRYKITVDKPDGFEFTQQFATFNGSRQPAIDSNINPVNGMSNVINLNPGAKNLTVDAGLIAEPKPARLGDFVFNDLDEDGIQDEGEPGIEGATVILQNPAGDTLEETVTNADGFYHFDDLTSGRYKVNFVQPDGFNAVSPFLVGGDRSIDSDANPNNGLMSRVVTLAPGEVNKTIDAGFFNDTPDVNPGIDLEKLVRVEPVGFPPGNFGPDVGDDYGKPQALVFQYTGGAATTQTAQDSDTKASGATMFDDVVTVSAADKKGRSIFSQEVELGERVTISASDFGKGKFDSESHFSIHGDSGTQSMTYHTSGSEPIRLGDVMGGLTLVGFQGEDGSTSMPKSNPTDDLDADNAPGPDARVGDKIVFTYVVNNTGDTPLGNIRLTDDRLDPSFVDGDSNGNGLLDTNEEWIYTASETANEGLQTNIGTVIGIPVSNSGDILGIDDVSDTDLANYTGSIPTPPPISGDLCEIFGKPTALTFLYEPSNEVNTVQKKFELSGTADDDHTAFIVADGGKFFGRVSAGETFTVAAGDGKKLGSDTAVQIFDEIIGIHLLQEIEFDTSCSDPIQLGDQIGSLTIVGYTGEDGSANLTEEQIDSLVG